MQLRGVRTETRGQDTADRIYGEGLKADTGADGMDDGCHWLDGESERYQAVTAC